MSAMSCGSIFSKNCKDCCFIIIDIFLALREGRGRGGGGGGGGTSY